MVVLDKQNVSFSLAEEYTIALIDYSILQFETVLEDANLSWYDLGFFAYAV